LTALPGSTSMLPKSILATDIVQETAACAVVGAHNAAPKKARESKTAFRNMP
jgi:hypothetical protein